jgi:hypothetical protein
MSDGKFSPRRPDFVLWMTSKKETKNKCIVGAGWTNSKGGISIRIDPANVLSWRDRGEFYYTLWPNERKDGSTVIPAAEDGDW